MIDLHQFCATDPHRPDMRTPFSRGDHTYATNGHIGVRVSRRADVPEGSPDLEGMFPAKPPELSPARFANLKAAPVDTEEECGNCNGSGKEHDCPQCDCSCLECDGKSRVHEGREIINVSLRGAVFDLKYINTIAALPDLMLPVKAPDSEAMYFSFSGGDGLLMPRVRVTPSFDAESGQQSLATG